VSTRVPPELAVLMHGRHIATLRRRGPARPLRLIYDPDVTAGTTPLSVTMPHVVPGHEGPHVRHWIAGLLPDRPEVLLAWRRAFAVASLEEYALLAHVGRDVAGAAQFCRPDRLGEATSPADLLEIDLAGVGARLAELADSTSGWGVQAGHAQFSLAGAQAKIALYFDAGRWAVPTGMAATTHILKPAIRGMAEQDLSEHLTMATAALLGLPVASTQVLLFAGHRALVVRRYDRLVRDGAVRRIHQEDLVQALGRPPTDKYQAGGGPGLADLLALLRRTVSPSARSEDVDSLLEAAAVNWLLGCTDAHARNYSLLLAGGEVRLAPLYDLNSFLPYASAPDRGVTLSMAIGPVDRYGSLEIDRHDWEWLARRANVDERRLVERVRWLADAVPDAAAQAAAGAEQDGSVEMPVRPLRDFARRYVRTVTAHATACRERLDGG
jgi:serine/threonine-protein kinase HipA